MLFNTVFIFLQEILKVFNKKSKRVTKNGKISLNMLRIPQGLIFCIFYKNLKKFFEQ